MRIDTMLSQNGYNLPNDWHRVDQVELKMAMTRHMMGSSQCFEFMKKLTKYSDFQFGQMCVRLANKK